MEPYTNSGTAWANSLFEDNAEFGLGLRLAANQRKDIARRLLEEIDSSHFTDLQQEILNAVQKTDSDLALQRDRVKVLREWLKELDEKRDQTAHLVQEFFNN